MVLSSFGERLKKLREEKGLSLRQVEAATGITNSNLSKIERNRVSPSLDAALLISDYLNVSLDYLTKGIVKYDDAGGEQTQVLEIYNSLDENNRYALKTYAAFLLSGTRRNLWEGASSHKHTGIEPEAESLKEERSVYLPLLGTAAAGLPIMSDELLEGFVPVPAARIKKNTYLIKVKGDSMIEAGINNGDLVIVAPQPGVENGEIALVNIDGEVTIKKFYRYDFEVRLKPANSSMKDIVVTDLAKLRILGKVTGIISAEEARQTIQQEFNAD